MGEREMELHPVAILPLARYFLAMPFEIHKYEQESEHVSMYIWFLIGEIKSEGDNIQNCTSLWVQS